MNFSIGAEVLFLCFPTKFEIKWYFQQFNYFISKVEVPFIDLLSSAEPKCSAVQ